MNLIAACIFAAIAAESAPAATGNAAPIRIVAESTNSAGKAAAAAPAMARITSKTTYYDRKEGFAQFSGDVFVDDREYQLHADSAFVFMDSTNELSRIVALGHIALTNDNRRAYGEKVSYYRQPGLVVLHGGAGRPAEVLEITSDGERSVRGKKIKFWIGSEQVEVVEADITAPTKGELGDLKGLGR